MTRDEIERIVRNLDQLHLRDHDGGYALIRELVAFARSLTAQDQRLLREVLIDLVATEDPSLWAVAVETLVQEGAPESALRLARLLEAEPHSLELQDDVIRGLLRLRFSPSLDRIKAHIRAGLTQGRLQVLTLLAALIRIAPDSAVEMAADFFAEQLPREADLSWIEGYVPAFVLDYVEEDDLLLKRLVRRTARANPRAGSLLSWMIRNYLSKPWVVAKLGKERVDNLQRELSASDTAL